MPKPHAKQLMRPPRGAHPNGLIVPPCQSAALTRIAPESGVGLAVCHWSQSNYQPP